jgi:hypothetical protein
LTDSDSVIGTETDDDLSLNLAALHLQNSLSDDSEEHIWDDNSNDILSELEKIDSIDQFFDRMGVYGWSDPHDECYDFSKLHRGYWEPSTDPEYLSVWDWDCYCQAHPLIRPIDPINDSFM